MNRAHADHAASHDRTGRTHAGRRLLIVAAGTLALIVVPFTIFGTRLETWSRQMLGSEASGIGSQLLCVLLLASDVILPIPSSLVSIACGATWGPWLGTGLSTLGMTLGSALGYGIGRWAGSEGVARWVGTGGIRRVEDLYRRHGHWIVVILRPVPVLAEASAIFAGVSRLSPPRYLALSVAANATVSVFYAGAAGLAGRAPGIAGAVLLFLLVAIALPWSLARRRA